MALETAVYSRLANYAGMSAQVGTKIYRSVLPQSVVYPAISYQRISTTRESAMGADIGVATARVQVDSWAETHAGAETVAALVRGALQRWNGTVESVVVLDTFIEDERHETEQVKDGQWIYRIGMDALIWHRE